MPTGRIARADTCSGEVERLLKQRGLEISQASPAEPVFLPPGQVREAIDEFYALLKHYSFRLFLRDVIQFQRQLTIARLTRFVDANGAARYLEILARLGMIRRQGGRQTLTGVIQNFGGTLEWFVARVLATEFAIPALHGVRLKSTDFGGDYDVIGAMTGLLVYVETKSSPPKHIEDREVAVFLRRLTDLSPDLAIFLVDTNLRMMDKVVGMFEKALLEKAMPGVRSPARRARPKRVQREIYHLANRIFITNSKHDLVSNLRRCLKAFHSARFDLGRILSD